MVTQTHDLLCPHVFPGPSTGRWSLPPGEVEAQKKEATYALLLIEKTGRFALQC